MRFLHLWEVLSVHGSEYQYWNQRQRNIAPFCSSKICFLAIPIVALYRSYTLYSMAKPVPIVLGGSIPALLCARPIN